MKDFDKDDQNQTKDKTITMLAYASVLYLTICRITWSLWRGTQGLTKLGLKFMS